MANLHLDGPPTRLWTLSLDDGGEHRCPIGSRGLVYVADGNVIKSVDVLSGRVVHRFRLPCNQRKLRITPMLWGSRLIAASARELVVWSLNGDELDRIKGDFEDVYELVALTEQEMVFSVGNHSVIKINSETRGVSRVDFDGHFIGAIGGWIAVAKDSNVRLVDAINGASVDRPDFERQLGNGYFTNGNRGLLIQHRLDGVGIFDVNKVTWKFVKLPSDVRIEDQRSLIASDGSGLFLSRRGVVCCVNFDGSIRWIREAPFQDAYAQCSVCGTASGILAFFFEGWQMLDAGSGEIIWHEEDVFTRNPVSYGFATIDNIIVRMQGDELWCFG